MAQVSSTQPFTQVLPRELEQIQKRRKGVFPGLSITDSTADRVRPFGLGLSGGGIRSATFNLGILQGLAEKNLLKYVDYLSTVSGGGYIGSWLHGLIRNRHNGDPAAASDFLSPSKNPTPKPPEDDAIAFLRKFSNYPAPKPTLFSADIWVVVVIWIRNFLLNQLILAPALMSLILLVLITGIVYPRQLVFNQALTDSLSGLIAVGVVLIALGIAALIAGWNLRRVVIRMFESSATVTDTSATEHWSLLTVPLVFIASLVISSMRVNFWYSYWIALLCLPLFSLFLLFQLAGGFMDTYVALRHHERKPAVLAYFHLIWMSLAAAAVTAALIFVTWQNLPEVGEFAPWIQVAFGPTLICLSLFAGTTLLLGLMGSDYPDGAREWISRIGAMIAIVCAVWTGLFLLVVLGPWAFAWLLANYGAIALTATSGWLLTTIGGVLAGKSAAGPVKNGANGKSVLGWLISLAPPVFMVGYLLLLSFAVHVTLRHVTPKAKVIAAKTSEAKEKPAIAKTTASNPGESKTDSDTQMESRISGKDTKPKSIQDNTRPPTWLTKLFEPFGPVANEYFYVLAAAPGVAACGLQLPCVVLFLGVCVGVAWVASWRININEFSMHHMYKNRLVRCYLGASNEKRNPNALTGFDPTDDFSLADLLPGNKKPYYGPYAISNTALNLNAGSELAQQERKAASFIFTPLFCGFAPSKTREDLRQVNRGKVAADGYRPTRGYSCPSGPNLGTAMAISGAAANPNSGYHTSGPMAFLLTVFDARLGWWLGNPRRERPSKYPGPLFALKYLFLELLGQTTGRTKFVNLSDGGHFDNLGLYELVRRRCRYIIIGDGEQDGDLTFGSLGGVIRKCRADFGVEIDINPDPIRIAKDHSTAHYVVGTIEYPEDETGFYAPATGDGTTAGPQGKAKGWILYLKSSLTGDEPADVIEYQSRYPKFPHESTADQFFSESQFESYRRLGLHIIRAAFDGVPLALNNGNEKELLRVFQALTQKWYAPIPVSPEAATRLTDTYSSLMRRLGETSALAPLIPELLLKTSATGALAPLAGTAQITNEVVTFGLEIIQLMENVYTEFGFEHAPNRANPRNAGWIEVFRRWAQGNLFYNHIWTPVQEDYQPLFQKFMNDLHGGKKDDWPMRS
jgi:hypothetical protein